MSEVCIITETFLIIWGIIMVILIIGAFKY